MNLTIRLNTVNHYVQVSIFMLQNLLHVILDLPFTIEICHFYLLTLCPVNEEVVKEIGDKYVYMYIV